MSSITILDENDKSELNKSIDTRSPKKHTHSVNDIEGVFAVKNGGIGVSSLDANKVLYTSSASAIGQMSIPTEESVLMQDTSGAPYWKPSSDIGGATKSIITLTGYSGTTYTVTNNGDENYSGTIGSSESAMVKVNGFGVYTVSYELDGRTDVKTVDVNAIGFYTVDCHIVSFARDSYSKISAASKRGQAASLYAIGDTKAVVLNGTVGAYNFSNEITYMFIVAFDHNWSVEMNYEHHIVCSFAKSAETGGKDVAFTDSHYNAEISEPCFHMNASATNVGGWESSYMRNTICSQFKNALPSDLQAVLRTRTIYTDNVGSDPENTHDYTATTDTVYIPSEFEVHGKRSYSNYSEYYAQRQLEYYKNGASKMRYKSSNTSAFAYWWCRSPYYGTKYSFCNVGYQGDLDRQYANNSYGFAPLITI